MGETWWLILVAISSVAIGAFATYDARVCWIKKAPVMYLATDFLVMGTSAAALTYSILSLVLA